MEIEGTTMEQKDTFVVPKDIGTTFDAFLLGLVWNSYEGTLDCGDDNMNEHFQAFIAGGPLLRILLRIAGNWYNDHEAIQPGIMKIMSLAPRIVKCFEFLDRETVSDWHGRREWYESLWREKSVDLHGCLVQIDDPIKRVAEEIYKVPNSKNIASLKSHQILRVFLSFIQANLEVLLKSAMVTGEEFSSPFEVFLLFFKAKKMEKIDDHLNQVAKLIEDLKFLILFLGDTSLHYPKSLKVKMIDLLDDIEFVGKEAGHLCYRVLMGKLDNMDVGFFISKLLQKIEVIKEDVKDYVEEVHPETYVGHSKFLLAFGNAFLDYLNKLLDYRTDLIISIKNEIYFLSAEFASIIHFLMKLRHQHPENEDLKGIMAHFADVIDEVEYLFDSFMAQGCPFWYFKLRYSHIIKEVQVIKEKVMHIEESKLCENGVQEEVDIFGQYFSQVVNVVSTKVTVNLDQEQEIKNLLLGGKDKGLQLISIVGMPGLGKTTLAMKIYVDPAIVSRFPVCSWCTVSPTYQKRGLLLGIISSIEKLTDEIYKEKEEDLQKRLYQLLKSKGKYLIIMDDVWEAKLWDDFRLCLPDDNVGSRIIFTSRNEDLCLEGKPHTTFKLPFLSQNDSWYLLRHNVFEHGECPGELEVLGKDIATKCQGLPLLVNLVAVPLRDMEKKPSSWMMFLRSLSSQVAVGDSNMSQKILEQSERIINKSYEHLPDNLKPCLLYCSGFPKEQPIPVKKLIRLWVAEGFIMKTGQESIENAAEKCLAELINRSLLLDVDRRSNGSVKTCRIHALLHDFCIKKADEVNFLKIIDGSPAIYEQHRCLAVTHQDLSVTMPFGRHVSTLLFLFNYDQLESKVLFDPSLVILGLKHLKVLDLECITTDGIPSEIGQFVLLKYLALTVNSANSLSLMGKLCNLESFVVKGSTWGLDNDSLIPIEGMSKLRHLWLGTRMYPAPVYMQQDKVFQFSTVQTFGCLRLDNPKAEEFLRCFPNLGKLECAFDDFKKGYLNLDFLQKLEILKISSVASYKARPSSLRLPASLRQLTLSELALPWKEMTTIAKSLPMLEVLKLHESAFKGPIWDMESEEVEFSQLKFLKMDGLDIQYWSMAYPDQFLMLQQLVLCNCKKLNKIPDSFANIESLERIKMEGSCTRSAIESGKQIKQLQQDYNEKFEFIFPDF